MTDVFNIQYILATSNISLHIKKNNFAMKGSGEGELFKKKIIGCGLNGSQK